MRDRYRVYVCPEADCPAMGRKDATCPEHGHCLEAIIVRREVPETAEQKESRELLKKLKKIREQNDPMGLGSLSDFLKGWPPK